MEETKYEVKFCLDNRSRFRWRIQRVESSEVVAHSMSFAELSDARENLSQVADALGRAVDPMADYVGRDVISRDLWPHHHW